MAAVSRAVPGAARCVVVGGGVAGVSAAYHLARLGWTDTVLLERDRLTSGTTWHAAGLMGRIAGSARVTRMRRESAELYQELARETGRNTGFVQHGGLTIATTPERLHVIKNWARVASALGTNCQIISADEAKARAPVLNTNDVLGALWSPDDGQINPVDATTVVAAAAKRHGVQIFENTPVLEILKNAAGAVRGVRTDSGTIDCESVLLACGMWTRQIAGDAGANAPLWPCEHEYFLTESTPEAANLPVIRSYDEHLYMKCDAGKVLIGLFERGAKVAFKDRSRVPDDFSFGSFPDDMDHLEPHLMSAMHRLPLLGERGISTYFSGPESFTPDGNEMIGEFPEVPGLFVAAGYCSHGITCGPASGRMIAKWIDAAAEGRGLREDWFGMDVRRFHGTHWGEEGRVKARASEILGRQYGMVFPHQPLESSRNMVRSPFHDALTALGAAWSVAGCHERPEWFGDGTHPPGSWGEQGWHQHTRDECLAARSASAIFDQSSFTKIIVHGPDAEAVMQRVCSASVARAVNRCVYTLMLNSEGGIESECTVTRLAADRFLVVSGSAMRVKDAHWIKRAIGQSESVSVDDVTEKYGVLGVYGPAARSLLETVVGADFSDEEMPTGWARELDVHGVAVMFMRTAYTGEIGWELYIPTEGSVEDAVRVHTAIAEVGDAFGLRHGGAHALDTLRLEAGHPRWGADISAAETPAEVALGHAVSPKKLAFAGRDALAEAPLLKRLQLFRVDGITGPGNPYLLAGEPVYGADGTTVVGEVTSSSYSFCFGGLYAFAHVDAAVDTSTATGLTVRSTVHGSAYDVPDGNHPLTPMTKSPLAAARHAATQ